MLNYCAFSEGRVSDSVSNFPSSISYFIVLNVLLFVGVLAIRI